MKIKRIADLFCGAGGTSTGAIQACGDLAMRPDLLAVNHWQTAINTHSLEIIDWSIKGKSIFRRKRPLAANTIRRIAGGLRKFGGINAHPFLVMLYGTNDVEGDVAAAGGNDEWFDQGHFAAMGNEKSAESIQEPLDTITTKDRFLLVEPRTGKTIAELDILFRMLQPHELAAAMSFPGDYKFTGNRGDQICQIGNAVPIQLARAHVRALLQ
jgi:site-specific DNA-cytosine methylase